MGPPMNAPSAPHSPVCVFPVALRDRTRQDMRDKWKNMQRAAAPVATARLQAAYPDEEPLTAKDMDLKAVLRFTHVRGSKDKAARWKHDAAYLAYLNDEELVEQEQQIKQLKKDKKEGKVPKRNRAEFAVCQQ